ncbi:CHAP domain-containing protein [Lactococcus garvieae]|uniref:CHAP domain-containing protein n=1 Tax=Lactococcus garvieae TaxID=1363 RepID=UPI001E42FD3D|nr:CHAP domain-containing protein [Lactococcus garvieae]
MTTEVEKIYDPLVGHTVGSGECGALTSDYMLRMTGGKYQWAGESGGGELPPGTVADTAWNVYTTTNWGAIGFEKIDNPSFSQVMEGDIFFLSPATTGKSTGHTGIVANTYNNNITTFEQNYADIKVVQKMPGQNSWSVYSGFDGIVRKKGNSSGGTDDLNAFLTSKVNANFGLSIDQVVNFIYNDPRTNRFGVWCGNDKGKIKAVLNTVSSAGMSYAWFAAYEIQEGYNSSWGWLNHTVVRGDYLTDASLTAKDIINSCNNKSHGIAWDDPGGGTVGMVPQSVRNKGQSDFNSWPLGTIGVGYAQSTAAAAWAIWYPAGLSGSVNGVQDYGNPIQGCIDVIKQMGGELSSTKPTPNKGEIEMYLIMTIDTKNWYVSNGVQCKWIRSQRFLKNYQNDFCKFNLPVDQMYSTELYAEFPQDKIIK